METLSHREIQEVLLGILKELDGFCRSHDIRYSIAGGTLLGALRHKGFIPWDDDADVIMPRPDYDRFVALFNKECTSHYHLLTQERKKDKWYVNTYSKLEDSSTESHEPGLVGVAKFGVNIDIFPVDGLPDDPEEQMRIIRRTMHYKRRIVLRQKTFLHLFLPHQGPPLAFFGAKTKSLDKWLSLADELLRSHDFSTSNYAAAICGLYAKKEIFPRQMFEEYAEYSFEGVPLMGLKKADEYLTSLYGDWHQLPPESERGGKHRLIVYKK